MSLLAVSYSVFASSFAMVGSPVFGFLSFHSRDDLPAFGTESKGIKALFSKNLHYFLAILDQG
jgi:hypothetical protein